MATKNERHRLYLEQLVVTQKGDKFTLLKTGTLLTSKWRKKYGTTNYGKVINTQLKQDNWILLKLQVEYRRVEDFWHTIYSDRGCTLRHSNEFDKLELDLAIPFIFINLRRLEGKP